ncbi:hypothetical protein Mapa_005827 [Marchantia paleacea]|nr:hypothetical protein Mapa_005827 [Marchantia paleacea]
MEQDQDSWWMATKNAVWSCLGSAEAVARGISVAQVCAVAVTGQMQDVILLPGPGLHKRCNAILYSDARAQSEAAEIAKLGGGSDNVASITGFPQGASSVLAKLRWLDKRDPKSAQQCRSLLLGGHDYVVWKLCGLCVTDATTASTTGLTNGSFQYAEDLLERVELGHWIDKLPTIVASNSPCGELNSHAAVELGCAALQGVPVIHCCGDAGACTLGAGAGGRGTTYAYLGTSGWVAGSFAKKSSLDKRSEVKLSGVYTLAHPDPSLVFKTGSIMTAGGNLAWAASNLVATSEAIDMKELDGLVKSVPAGSGGLLYLPYLNGERCPFEDPNARASFVGISAVTTRGHLLRSVMEGVALAMRSARDAMFADPLPEDISRPLYLVGGGARSPVWPAIMAAVFGQTVDVLEDAQEVGVKGAALLAGQWLGWECGHENWVQVNNSFIPSTEEIELYEELFATYSQAYSGLKHVHKSLSNFQKSSRVGN